MKEHVERILAHVRRTDLKYRALYRTEPSTKPIPFFGNPESALVITLGLNPSWREFERGRGWHAVTTDAGLVNRLLHYFSPKFKPHKFFSVWEKALAVLDPGLNYANGTAAHLDLSPRATDFPSRHQQDNDWRKRFLEMLREDIYWLFEALKKCRKTRLVMMAGTATDLYYLSEFVSEFSPPGVNLLAHARGYGKNASFHKLVICDLSFPVFSSGAGPAFQNGLCLTKNVQLNRVKLNSLLRL